MSASFRVYAPLEAFEKADDAHSLRIGGIVSTDLLDRQGEIIVQEGLDFSEFLTSGWFNDNHGQKTSDVLGYPTDAFYVKKGDLLPSGKRAAANGWWAEGYLVGDEGRRIWNLCNSLAKSPRRLGFSIEGSVEERDRNNRALIRAAKVRNVAITHCPVNTGTEMFALAKALTAGSAIANPGAAPGEGFALRRESVEGAPAAQQDPVDPETDDDDEDEVAKAVDAHFAVVDEIDIAREWAPILQRQLENLEPPAQLTKAEARIIVAARLPHLSSRQVNDIVEKAHRRQG